MVRACFAEESTVVAHVNGLLRNRVPSEVGIVIGRPGVGSRDFLLALIPTPKGDDDDEGGASSAGGGGGKKKKGGAASPAALALDEEWAAEHACQVSRMLPGGLHVIGIYVFCPEPTFKGSQAAIQGVVRAVAASTPSLTDADGPWTDRIVLHVDPTTSRYAAKACPAVGAGAAAGTMKGCEYKSGPALNGFVCVATSYALDAEMHVPAAGKGRAKRLRDQVGALLEREGARLRGAAGTLSPTGGRTLSGAEAIAKALPKATATSPTEVSLFLPPASAAPYDPSAPPLGGGIVRARGVVHARAYVYNREGCGKAVEALAGDVLSTLRSRFDIVCDDADREEEEEEEAEEGGAPRAPSHPLLASEAAWAAGGDAGGIALPRRVLLPWLSGLCLCDYLLPGEGGGEACERAREVLGLEVEGGAGGVTEVERQSSAPRPGSTAAPTGGSGAAKAGAGVGVGGEGGGGGGGGGACTKSVIAGAAAAGVALVSAALGWMMLDE